MCGGGGGTPKETTSNVTQTSIPKELMPYAQQMMGQASALTNLNQNPYMPYQGQRIADFSPLRTQAFYGIQGMQTSPLLNYGANMLGQGADLTGQGSNLLNWGADLTGQGGQYVGAGADIAGQGTGLVGAGANIAGQGTGLIGQGADIAGQGQGLINQGAGVAGQGTGYLGQGAGLAGIAGLGGLNTNRYNTGWSNYYMSPYMQNVVNTQKREAIRDADIAATQRGARAATSGAFGGNRQTLLDAEANRNLATQLGDIQAKGLQSAYEQGTAQFNADEARRLQGLGLTSGAAGILGNLGGAYGQLGGTIGGLGSAMGQLGGTIGNLGNVYGQLGGTIGGLGGTMGQLGGTIGGLGGTMGNLGGTMGNLGGTYGQLGGTMGNLGGTMGNLGQTAYDQQMNIYNAQQQAGKDMEQRMQDALSMNYQDFLTQQNYPYQQLSFLSSLLHGIPTGDMTRTEYNAPGSQIGQLAGLGAGLGSLFMSGK